MAWPLPGGEEGGFCEEESVIIFEPFLFFFCLLRFWKEQRLQGQCVWVGGKRECCGASATFILPGCKSLSTDRF